MIVRNATRQYPERIFNRVNVATESCPNGGNRTFKCTVDKSTLFVKATGIDQLKGFYGKRLKQCQVVVGNVSNAVDLKALMS